MLSVRKLPAGGALRNGVELSRKSGLSVLCEAEEGDLCLGSGFEAALEEISAQKGTKEPPASTLGRE